MISKVKAVLKLAAAALLSFAAAPLYANGAPYVPPAQILGFTEANQTPPFITSKDMTRGAVSDGSLTFSLDMFFGTNTPNSFAISPMIQYDSAKLDIIEIANVAHAGFFKPEPSRINDRKFKIADWSRKPAFAGADTEFLLVWMDLNEITAVSGATPENPVRLATIKFKWKAGTTGASQIAIVESEAGISDENFRGVSVDIQGVEVAEATAAEAERSLPPEPDILLSETHISITEGDEATFRVGLTAPLKNSEHVFMKVSHNGGKDLTVAPASLTFTANNWETGEEVTVRSKDNTAAATDKKYTITLAVDKEKTNATLFHHKTKSVSVTITDDEKAVVLSVSPANLCKAGAESHTETITITARLRRLGPQSTDTRLVLAKTAIRSEFAAANHTVPDDFPEEITIPAGETSASKKFSITLGKVDKENTFHIREHVELAGGESGGVAPRPSPGPAPSPSPAPVPSPSPTPSPTPSPSPGPTPPPPPALTLAPAPAPTPPSPPDSQALGTVSAKLIIRPFDLNVDARGDDPYAKANAYDGIMAMRYLLGVHGEALTAGQSNAAPTDVAKCLSGNTDSDTDNLNSHLHLDVDEDGDSDSDDGTLIARYLLGLRGDVLVKDFDDMDPNKVANTIEAILRQ